jgi:hypothetical protein
MYIDCDGVPFWMMEQAIGDVREQFEDVTVRAYKDWTNPGNNRLMVSLWALDVALAQVTPHAGLKNGTDIAIAVEVVDALTQSPTDAVALVGNDGDFAPLVNYLRRKGARVLGFGSRDASASLATACDSFLRFDSTTRAPVTGAPPAKELDELIAEVMASCADADGWTRLDRFGFAIRAKHGLGAKDTGCRSWIAYLRRNARFECLRELSGLPRARAVSSGHRA